MGGVCSRERARVLAEHTGDSLEHPSPVERRHAPPFGERCLGGADCGVDILSAAIRDSPQRVTGARIDLLRIAAVLRLVPTSAIVGPALYRQVWTINGEDGVWYGGVHCGPLRWAVFSVW